VRNFTSESCRGIWASPMTRLNFRVVTKGREFVMVTGDVVVGDLTAPPTKIRSRLRLRPPRLAEKIGMTAGAESSQNFAHASISFLNRFAATVRVGIRRGVQQDVFSFAATSSALGCV
jgi:hypothetical protein